MNRHDVSEEEAARTAYEDYQFRFGLPSDWYGLSWDEQQKWVRKIRNEEDRG